MPMPRAASPSISGLSFFPDWHRTAIATAVLAIWLMAASSGSAETYRVSPEGPLKSLSQVPWSRLLPGDVVEIPYRPEPYRSKISLSQRGTAGKPIIIRGLPGPAGELPVLDGNDAVTPPGLDFPGEVRGVIVIGPPSDNYFVMPGWITIENLDICHARKGNFFLGRKGLAEYTEPASAIYVEKGENLVFRNCRMHDCGNGFFTNHETKSILVEGCSIYSNGNKGSIYEHNSYTETDGITFQTCRFGPLIPGAGGNNLKDRSAGLVVRYSLIDGGNKQLDLVDAQEGAYLRERPNYDVAYVYGNVFIEHEGNDNNQIVHFGGDSGPPDQNRKGPLWFCHNTVVSLRTSKTCLFRLTTNQQQAEVANNIFYTAAEGNLLSIVDESGDVKLQNCWLKSGWRRCHGEFDGRIVETDCLTGDDPGFVDIPGREFRLKIDSPVRGKASVLRLPDPHQVRFEPPGPKLGPQRRPDVPPIDLGAFGFTR